METITQAKMGAKLLVVTVKNTPHKIYRPT